MPDCRWQTFEAAQAGCLRRGPDRRVVRGCPQAGRRGDPRGRRRAQPRQPRARARAGRDRRDRRRTRARRCTVPTSCWWRYRCSRPARCSRRSRRISTPDCVVTDAAAPSAMLLRRRRRRLGGKLAQFVPAHPIAGAERSGVEAATRRPVSRTGWSCSPRCPRPLPRPAAASRRPGACAAPGSVQMDPLRHDQVFAAVSHLPHALAFALVSMIAARPDAAELFSFAGAGFRDFTRIAGSSPEMWRDICVANRDALLAEIEAFQAELTALASSIRDGDAASVSACSKRRRRPQPLAAAFIARARGRAIRLISICAPLARARGSVQLPGSKSISNRTLLLAALARRRDRDPRSARLGRRGPDAGGARDARRCARARRRRRGAARAWLRRRVSRSSRPICSSATPARRSAR